MPSEPGSTLVAINDISSWASIISLRAMDRRVLYETKELREETSGTNHPHPYETVNVKTGNSEDPRMASQNSTSVSFEDHGTGNIDVGSDVLFRFLGKCVSYQTVKV